MRSVGRVGMGLSSVGRVRAEECWWGMVPMCQ